MAGRKITLSIATRKIRCLRTKLTKNMQNLYRLKKNFKPLPKDTKLYLKKWKDFYSLNIVKISILSKADAIPIKIPIRYYGAWQVNTKGHMKKKIESQNKTKMDNSEGHVILLNIKIYCNISVTKTM